MNTHEIEKRYQMWLQDDPYIDANNLMIQMYAKIRELERRLHEEENWSDRLQAELDKERPCE